MSEVFSLLVDASVDDDSVERLAALVCVGDDDPQPATVATSMTVDAVNQNYSNGDGVLFDKLQTTLIQCPGGKIGSYTIPSSVANIASRPPGSQQSDVHSRILAMWTERPLG